jgi:hypothetical protein
MNQILGSRATSGGHIRQPTREIPTKEESGKKYGPSGSSTTTDVAGEVSSDRSNDGQIKNYGKPEQLRDALLPTSPPLRLKPSGLSLLISGQSTFDEDKTDRDYEDETSCGLQIRPT